jgi:hypothetical protein
LTVIILGSKGFSPPLLVVVLTGLPLTNLLTVVMVVVSFGWLIEMILPKDQ